MTVPKAMFTLTIGLAAVSASPQPSFITLGAIPGRNTISHAFDVSADGSVVIGATYPNGVGVPFRWTADTGFVTLDPAGIGAGYTAQAISPSGEYTVGQYSIPGGALGYVHRASDGASFTVPDLPGGADNTFVGGVGDNGLVLGSSAVGAQPNGQALRRAVQWTPGGGLVPLPLPNPGDELRSSTAGAVLSDGQIYMTVGDERWLYAPGINQFERITGPEFLRAINSDATFMVGQATDFGTLSGEAVYWTPDTGQVFLPQLPGGTSGPGQAQAMSDDGSIIVGVQSITQVIWIDQGTPVPLVDYAASLGLDMDGWAFINVRQVSDDGSTIVGTARHVSWVGGRVEAFVLTIPAPSAAAVWALPLALAARRRRR
jgi:uncharacterized membrane protein